MGVLIRAALSGRAGRASGVWAKRRAALQRHGHALADLILPATINPREDGRDDYRRVIFLIAALALGFFPISWLVAGVPAHLWPLYSVAAFVGGSWVAVSFFLAPRGSRTAAVLAIGNAAIIAFIGWVLQDHYHQVGLLYMLLVAGHSIVHGLRAALGVVAMGSVLVPFVLHARAGVNWTDPIYAAIYLFGVAIITWTASQLAHRRALALQQQATVNTERKAMVMLAAAAEAKDEVTGTHVSRVGDLARELAAKTSLSATDAEDVRFAAMLHDVGKLHVPDRILLKPGPLDPEEWDVIREHAVWGERILAGSRGFELARTIARSHHENWDGTGYPDRLRGEAIPFPARIVRLVDVLDALIHERPYKPAWPLDRCLEEITRQSGRQFDPDLVPVFVTLLERDRASIEDQARQPIAIPVYSFGETPLRS